jgi:hypothetical protein
MWPFDPPQLAPPERLDYLYLALFEQLGDQRPEGGRLAAVGVAPLGRAFGASRAAVGGHSPLSFDAI